jgi:hypothetical protein
MDETNAKCALFLVSELCRLGVADSILRIVEGHIYMQHEAHKRVSNEKLNIIVA